jgi:carbonic anhydrase
LSEIEFGIIRNAGGRAADAVRSLVVLDALVPVGAVMVVHHTGILSPV